MRQNLLETDESMQVLFAVSLIVAVLPEVRAVARNKVIDVEPLETCAIK